MRLTVASPCAFLEPIAVPEPPPQRLQASFLMTFEDRLDPPGNIFDDLGYLVQTILMIWDTWPPPFLMRIACPEAARSDTVPHFAVGTRRQV